MNAKISATVTYGNDADYDPDDEWRNNANPWAVTLQYGRRQYRVPYWTGTAITDEPTARDVLESLCLDANVGDQTFADFCADLGYDTDSRKAYTIWEACKNIGPKLRRLLGDDLYDQLTGQSSDDWPADLFAEVAV